MAGKKSTEDKKKLFFVSERKSTGDKAASTKGGAGLTRENDDHWIQTPPKLDFHVVPTPDHVPIVKQVASLHQDGLREQG